MFNVLARLGISKREYTLSCGKGNDLYSACLVIATRNGKELGTFGIVSKAQTHKCDVKAPVFYAELDWDALTALALKRTVTYHDLPRTLPVRRDLALLVDEAVSMADIEAVVRETERKNLRGVTLFDVYEGKNLPEDKKSYAIAITLQDDEKTLNDKAIDAMMNKIIAQLRKRVGAELR